MSEAPAEGDVLITTEGGRHLLSVVPHPHRISLSELSAALEIARKWADANNTHVWRRLNGELVRLPRD